MRNVSALEMARIRESVERHFDGLAADPPAHLMPRWKAAVRRLMAGDMTALEDVKALQDEERAFNKNGGQHATGS